MKFTKKLFVFFFILAIAFTLIALFRYKDNIQEIVSYINWPLFLIATLFLCLNTASSALFFFHTLPNTYEEEIYKVTAIFCASQLSKYTPGKIWNFAHQIILLNNKHTVINILSTNASTTILQLVNTSLIAICCLVLSTSIILGIASCILVCLVSPFTSNKTISLANTILKKIKPKLQIPYIQLHLKKQIFLHSLFITSFILAYTLFTLALYFKDISVTEALAFTSISATGWIIGMLTIISPSGIGIREAAIIGIGTLFLSNNASITDLVLFSISLRIWTTFTDLISGLLASIFLLLKRRANL